ncbi:phosphodiester glycosidase family protein [Glaesserella sp.]|uniref:phosphodiester glycosidase family protein n=1 Tax=Glaesserella sp. TaxID=2094731 RepID=UPI0035A0D34A
MTAKYTRFLLGLGLFTGFLPHGEAKSACIQTTTQESYIHIARIDLNCPTVELIGTSPTDKGISVSDFAQKNQTDIAVNANFYRKDLSPIGLVISNGKTWHKSRDTRSRVFFACTTDNKCLIEGKNRLSKTDPKWQVAVSGWHYFEQKSAKFECAANDKIGCSQDIFSGKHPRTMLGLDEKRNALYLVVVEGRQLGFRGMTLDELAALAVQLDLTKAINLDGGGSSTMVVGNHRLSALPLLQSSERKIANHFGVKLNEKP